MNAQIVYRIALFVGVVFLQVLLFNHIHLMGYATPFIYVYFPLTARTDCQRSLSLIISFLLGLCIDISTSTPGVAACSLTIMVFVLPTILNRTIKKNHPVDAFTPSAKYMGWSNFMTFVSLSVLIFTSLYYSILWFAFENLGELFLYIFGSSIITIVVIAIIERIHSK